MKSYPLQVPTNKDRIYDQFLTIINFLIYENDKGNAKLSPLTNKELSVLAAVMYYNDKYAQLAPTLDIYLDTDLSIEFKLSYAELPEESTSPDPEPIEEVQPETRESEQLTVDDGQVYSSEDGGDTEGGGQSVRSGDSADDSHNSVW